MSVTAYIGIGSNIKDKRANCLRAIDLLKEAGRVVKVSSFFCTEPIGYVEQEDFVNAVIALETSLTPEKLLAACRSIEDALGRIRTVKWGPRILDLDILLYGDQVVKRPDLVIPHPLMETRKFVLVPLAEIAPGAMHPVLRKTAKQLLHDLKDDFFVEKCKTDGTEQ